VFPQHGIPATGNAEIGDAIDVVGARRPARLGGLIAHRQGVDAGDGRFRRRPDFERPHS
jgi:hypothetical protein